MKRIITTFLIISFLILLGCSKASKIKDGDIVTIIYTGIFENGEIFETNKKTIKIGDGDIIKGIENSLINKNIGKTFKLKIKPEEGYGDQYSIYNRQKIGEIIFQRLGLETEIGSIVTLDKISGKVIDNIKDENGNNFIIFDINPPQTRQDIKYEITIEKVETNE